MLQLKNDQLREDSFVLVLTKPDTSHDDGRPVGHSVHLVPVLQPARPPLAEGVREYLHGVALDDLHAAALLSHNDDNQQH